MFQFDADNPLIDEGVWREFRGSKFKIAHISNDKFQRSLAKHQQPFRKRIESGTLDPTVHKDLLCKAMSEAILIDWKDVSNSRGQAEPFSPKAALIALKKSQEFRDFVTDIATSLSDYVSEEVEELGNGSESGPLGEGSGAQG